MLCQKTKIFHSITILTLLLFNHIQCKGEKNQEKGEENLSQPPDQNQKIIDELTQDYETKKAIVNVLIGINCFLFIMILFIVIYEIIKYRQRRKMKDTLLFSLQKKNITNKENSSNRKSNIEYSSIIKNTKKSFNSSKMMESANSNNISNNYSQKPFLNESNNSYRERSDSGYEAPVVQNYEKKKEEKIFTNDGAQSENDNRKFKNVCNSGLNENNFFTNNGNENKNEDKLFINDINDNKKASLLENPF
jgi:hypothetical protein